MRSFSPSLSIKRRVTYTGTVNGLLILRNQEGGNILIDCQGSESSLEVLPDEHAVYDVSTKRYTGKSTSRKTKFSYATYASANRFEITLNKKVYSIGIFDGASDMVINGLNYQYVCELGMEYLILQFTKLVELDTCIGG